MTSRCAPRLLLVAAFFADGLGVLSTGCASESGHDAPPAVYDVLPADFPRPFVPEDEPVTAERVELGRRLFYDTRLSGNGTQSCASCHVQALAFTDGRTTALGSTGESHFRNAQTLANVAYVTALTWASPLHGSLAGQALLPMFGEAPVELGLAGEERELLRRLEDERLYADGFARAFPDDATPVTLRNVTVALATFERTLISYRSPFDRYVYGHDASAITHEQRRGLDLFFDERFECFHCHGTFNFSDSVRTATSRGEVAFHNTGLYNLDGSGAYPAIDSGLMRVTTQASDMGRFRAPTLRNVAVTAPYFHDGSAATLDDVLDHYARGGRRIDDGPNRGDGALSPLKSGFVRGIEMTAEERSALRSFLDALTDDAFLHDPALSDPWAAP